MDVFFKDLIERAVKTFCQSLLATLGMAYALNDVDWYEAISVALLATLISVLTSCASLEFGDDGTASVLSTKKTKKTTKKSATKSNRSKK